MYIHFYYGSNLRVVFRSSLLKRKQATHTDFSVRNVLIELLHTSEKCSCTCGLVVHCTWRTIHHGGQRCCPACFAHASLGNTFAVVAFHYLAQVTTSDFVTRALSQTLGSQYLATDTVGKIVAQSKHMKGHVCVCRYLNTSLAGGQERRIGFMQSSSFVREMCCTMNFCVLYRRKRVHLQRCGPMNLEVQNNYYTHSMNKINKLQANSENGYVKEITN